MLNLVKMAIATAFAIAAFAFLIAGVAFLEAHFYVTGCFAIAAAIYCWVTQVYL